MANLDGGSLTGPLVVDSPAPLRVSEGRTGLLDASASTRLEGGPSRPPGVGGRECLAESSPVQPSATCTISDRRVSRLSNEEARQELTASDPTSPKLSPSSRRPSGASPVLSDASEATVDDFSVGSLKERAELMLLGSGEHPIASGMPRAASAITNGLILDAVEACNALWPARKAGRKEEIKASCAPVPVDGMDVLAYIVADALKKPLLHSEDTNAYGKLVASKHTRAVAQLKKNEKAASDQARRALKGAPPQSPGAAQAAAMGRARAAFRAERVLNLEPPSRTVGRKRKAPEPEPTPDPPPRLLYNIPESASEEYSTGYEAGYAAGSEAGFKSCLAVLEAESKAASNARVEASRAERERADVQARNSRRATEQTQRAEITASKQVVADAKRACRQAKGAVSEAGGSEEAAEAAGKAVKAAQSALESVVWNQKIANLVADDDLAGVARMIDPSWVFT